MTPIVLISAMALIPEHLLKAPRYTELCIAAKCVLAGRPFRQVLTGRAAFLRSSASLTEGYVMKASAAAICTLLLTAGLAACSGLPVSTSPEAEAPFDFSSHLAGKTLLFVGAHPDDEQAANAFMAEACLFNGASCHYAVVSEARSYGCYLTLGMTDPAACSDLRREEMHASAALTNGTVSFFGWDDLFYAHNNAGLDRNIDAWAAKQGGRGALVARFAAEIGAVKPDIVFSLDPRHGVTCNPNHRAVSLLLSEAINSLPDPSRPELWFENDFMFFEHMSDEERDLYTDKAGYSWPADDPPLVWYDGTRPLPNGRTPFDYVADTLKAHASQYPGVADGSEDPLPPVEARRVPMVRASSIDASRDLCSALDLDFPTFDVVGYPDTE